METVNFNNLTFVIGIVLMFAVLHQEISVKPLLVKMKNAGKEIFNKTDFNSLEDPAKLNNNKLNESFEKLKEEYTKLYSFLMSNSHDYHCNNQAIWGDEETSQCKFVKNNIATKKSYTRVQGIIYSSIIIAFLVAVAPVCSFKMCIFIYYALLFVLLCSLGYILWSIHMFRQVEFKLFTKENNKIDELEKKYKSTYAIYKDYSDAVALNFQDKAKEKTSN